MPDGNRGRKARIEVWTHKYRLIGNLHIPMGQGYKARLSDVLNEEKRPFLPLTDITLYSMDGEALLWTGSFLALNKASIVLVKALEE